MVSSRWAAVFSTGGHISTRQHFFQAFKMLNTTCQKIRCQMSLSDHLKGILSLFAISSFWEAPSPQFPHPQNKNDNVVQFPGEEKEGGWSFLLTSSKPCKHKSLSTAHAASLLPRRPQLALKPTGAPGTCKKYALGSQVSHILVVMTEALLQRRGRFKCLIIDRRTWTCCENVAPSGSPAQRTSIFGGEQRTAHRPEEQGARLTSLVLHRSSDNKRIKPTPSSY